MRAWRALYRRGVRRPPVITCSFVEFVRSNMRRDGQCRRGTALCVAATTCCLWGAQGAIPAAAGDAAVPTTNSTTGMSIKILRGDMPVAPLGDISDTSTLAIAYTRLQATYPCVRHSRNLFYECYLSVLLTAHMTTSHCHHNISQAQQRTFWYPCVWRRGERLALSSNLQSECLQPINWRH